jgi:hypothetical protein
MSSIHIGISDPTGEYYQRSIVHGDITFASKVLIELLASEPVRPFTMIFDKTNEMLTQRINSFSP